MPNNEMTEDWRELYREALFEADSGKALVRIDVASQAIRCRLCELWQLGPADARERSELDAAAYFLGLLRSVSGNKRSPQSSAQTLFVTGKQAS